MIALPAYSINQVATEGKKPNMIGRKLNESSNQFVFVFKIKNKIKKGKRVRRNFYVSPGVHSVRPARVTQTNARKMDDTGQSW